jgi:hypothetical protein
VHEHQPERALQLAAAAAALRESAGVPPLTAARTQTFLAPARHLGETAVTQLWAQGLTLTSDQAIAMATGVPSPKPTAGQNPSALTTIAETGTN